jgi:hypothetical protein
LTRRRHEAGEMHKLHDECDVKFIKLGGLRWAGHVIRVEESGLVKKVLCTKPGGSGSRRRGRPKLRWRDVARLGCRNWRIDAGQERSSGNSVRRSSGTQGCSTNGRRRRR